MSTATIKRSDFVQHFVQHAGLSYLAAERSYDAMMRLLENSVAAKSSVSFGRVGTLVATETKSRKVSMGFKRSSAGVTKCRREYFLGPRTKFVFRLHKTFGRRHGLA